MLLHFSGDGLIQHFLNSLSNSWNVSASNRSKYSNISGSIFASSSSILSSKVRSTEDMATCSIT